jgi:2-hydroxychromene-2-carboxylate isomerase
MTINVDLYYTMRSPYCYISTHQLRDLTATYALNFQLKPVYPLAVSDPTFFKRANPMLLPYIFRDASRTAERLDIPFRMPRPDPIVQDLETQAVSTEQPYIRRLTHLAQLAAEKGRGLEFVVSVSGMLFNPNVNGWDTGKHLSNAVKETGLDLEQLDRIADNEYERLESAIAMNRKEQLAAGHWGAPLFVTDDEIFFGQDRIEDLLWHLKKKGLASLDAKR